MTFVKNGKALSPHNHLRPEPEAVLQAVEAKDVEALKLLLTPRMRRFAEEYQLDYDQTKACIRAGYATKHAHSQASTLMKHRGVAFYIDHLGRSKAAGIVSVDPDYVIKQVTAIIGKEGTKDSDKLRACELLARHLGMFIDRTEITGRDGEAIEINNRRIEEEAESFTTLMRQLQERASTEKTLN